MNNFAKQVELPEDQDIKPKSLIEFELTLDTLEENIANAMAREVEPKKHREWLPNFKNILNVITARITLMAKADLLDEKIAQELSREMFLIVQKLADNQQIDEDQKMELLDEVRVVGLKVSAAVMKKIAQ